MSFDLDIVPTRSAPFSAGALVAGWARRLDARAALLGAPPRLRRLGSGGVLADDEIIAAPSHVVFELAVANTLTLSASPNEGNLDEREYLEDYGRNVDAPAIEGLAAAWRRAGYWYALSSGGGRSVDEPALLIGLAAAVADLCDGRVVVTSDGILDLGVGVYTPDDLARARWRAGG
jgi:hypothetical protein